MARPLRVEWPRAWFHVTGRGVDRRAIVTDDRDRRRWLALVQETVPMFGWVIHGYVLMDNHYHLILQLGAEANLSRGMHWLQTSYSMGFNRRHHRVGPLFQGRFGAELVEAEVWGLELSRYVHLNPVRITRLELDKRARQADRLGVRGKPDAAQVRERVQPLRHYRWSSYRAYAGLEPAPAWLTTSVLLDRCGKGGVRARHMVYARYVESAIRQGLEESPWDHMQARIILGGKQFVEKVRRLMGGSPREQPQRRALVKRPTWNQVVRVVERVRGERWETLRERHGDWGRELALYLGRRHCGLPLRELGVAVGGLDYAAVSVAVKRYERRLAREKPLRNAVESARQMLNVET
ncbi:MAG: transposase [Verrucomicrobia bacterium]|nr:transposase [Verrucomicrobiota bacterium]